MYIQYIIKYMMSAEGHSNDKTVGQAWEHQFGSAMVQKSFKICSQVDESVKIN